MMVLIKVLRLSTNKLRVRHLEKTRKELLSSYLSENVLVKINAKMTKSLKLITSKAGIPQGSPPEARIMKKQIKLKS